MLKKLFKDTAVYAFIPQLPKFASFFILPIITKDLTELDYGISGIVVAYIGGFIALKTIGLEDLFINYYYKHPKHYKIIWAHLFGFLSSYLILFVLIIGVVLFFVLPVSFNNRIIIVALSTSEILLFAVTNMFGFRFLQLKQKPIPIALISAISGFVVVFLNLYTISYLKLGYLGWFISAFVGSFIQFIYYAYIVFFRLKLSPIIKFRYKYIKKYLKVSAPLIPNKYGHFLLNSSDRVVMDLIKIPVKQLGIYNFGYGLGNYFQIITSAIGMSISPFYLQLFKNRDKESLNSAQKVTFIIQVCVLVSTIIAGLWMKEVFSILVSNTTLKTSYDIAIIIVISQNYAPLRFYFTNLVVFNEKTSFLWRITIVAGVINVVLNLIFLKIFGIRVAAITTFISMFYITVVGFYHKQYKNVENRKMYPIRWFLISVAILVIVYLIKDIYVGYKIIITIFILLSTSALFLKFKSRGYFKSLS